MHSCNILHWSQFLRSIARILRDRNYYSLNVKHYSYTIEVWRSGLGFPERVSSQWQWPLFYSQTQSGSSVETQTLEIRVVRAKNRAEWLAQCGPRLASYYKWLYVTHWEKCECEASQPGAEPAVIQSNYPDFNAASPPPHSSASEGITQLRPRFPVCCVLICFIWCWMLFVKRNESVVLVSRRARTNADLGNVTSFTTSRKHRGRQNYTSPGLVHCVLLIAICFCFLSGL